MREGERKVEGDKVEVMEGGDGEGRQMRGGAHASFSNGMQIPPPSSLCSLGAPRFGSD